MGMSSDAKTARQTPKIVSALSSDRIELLNTLACKSEVKMRQRELFPGIQIHRPSKTNQSHQRAPIKLKYWWCLFVPKRWLFSSKKDMTIYNFASLFFSCDRSIFRRQSAPRGNQGKKNVLSESWKCWLPQWCWLDHRPQRVRREPM